MNFLKLTAFLFFAVQAHANDTFIDLIPLQSQFRYEDTTEQTRATQTYTAYGLAYQFNVFRFGAELSTHSDRTGNQSLKIERNIVEFLFSGGYRAYHLAQKENDLSLDLWANLFMGQTKTEVTTILYASQNTSSSDADFVLGAGASLVGRFKYLMVETEFKMLQSKNMSPQEVPVFGVKVGLGIPL